MQEVKNILSKLKNKEFSPVYFFHGTESFYIDQVVNFIEKNVLSESEKSFNQTVLYGRDVDASQIVEVCCRLPMMASHQVVIVKEAQEIKNFDNFEKYFNKPVASTILVLAYKHKKIDKRKAIFKSIVKNTAFTVLETAEIRDYEIVGWISNYVKSQKLDVSPKAIELLAEFLGTDLAKISHEIDKLILIKGKGASISEEDIEKNIGISKEYNIFELTNALGERNNLKSHKIVNYFILNPKSLVMPLAMGTIYSFYTKLFLVKYAGNADSRTLGSILKINPFIAKNYMHYAANYDLRQIKNAFDYLREYDLKSKGIGASGATSQGEFLKELVAKILN